MMPETTVRIALIASHIESFCSFMILLIIFGSFLLNGDIKKKSRIVDPTQKMALGI
jgi:hypothetical protein